MKKFAIFVMILIVTVSLGVTVFYFARDREELIINSDAEIFVNQGDTVKFDVTLKNAKSGHKISIQSMNPEILESLGDGEVMGFDAIDGGVALVEISVTGSKNIKSTYIVVNVGNGNPSTPFYVDSEESLKEVASNSDVSGKSYLLLNDISLNENFTPLKAFSGTFNGKGYTISNLTITTGNAEAPKNAGLFSEIKSTGIVTNLNIKSVNINGQFENVGAIAGVNNGTISRCSVQDGTIVSTISGANVGGISGKTVYSTASTGRIDRTYSALNIQAQASGSNVGGLTGLNEGGMIINSYSTNFATSDKISVLAKNSNVGGIIGYNKFYLNNGVNHLSTVKNCYSNAAIDTSNIVENEFKSAGLIGYNEDVNNTSPNRIMGCYYNSDMIAVGMNDKYTIEFTSADVEQEKANFRGVYAFTFDASKNIVKDELNSYYSSDDRTTMVKWDFVNVWKLNSNVNNGYPTLNASGSDVPDDIAFLYNPTAIDNATKLYSFQEQVNSGSLTNEAFYRLTDNITLSGDFTPIGTKENPFTGTFDGNGFTISNLKINSTTASEYKYVGLFGYVSSSARIVNVNIENVTIGEGAMFAGAIVGYSEGATISNCSAKTKTNSKQVSVIATRSAGGIAGTSEGMISNCSVSNLVIVSKKVSSGATGYSKQRYAGGIVGENGVINTAKSGTVLNCKVVDSEIYDDYGTEVGLRSKKYCDGFTFDFHTIYNYVAGIAGSSNYKIENSVVSNCKIDGDKTDNTNMVAGIVGQSKATVHSKTEAEVYKCAVYDCEITAFNSSGIIGRIYGLADQNAVIGGTVTGFLTAGIVNNIKLGGKVINCVAGCHMSNTVTRAERTDFCCSGLFNLADFESIENMGEMYNCFGYCTFNAETYEDNYYDSQGHYKYIGDYYQLKYERSRDCGKADYLLLVETGNAVAQSYTWWFGITTVKNVKLISCDEATTDPIALTQQMTDFGFDVTGDESIWICEIGNYPTLRNIPENPNA